MGLPEVESTLKVLLSRAKYQHTDMTRKDAMEILQQYRGVTPKLDHFVFNDGTQKELVSLQGTIPVSYKGATYNIPVCIWLLDTHPMNAPMAYVKPTADMQIQVSRHVDHNGKVYLPYLHEWKQGKSDLLGLIQVMIITFSEQPPVYAKPATNAAQPYPTAAYNAGSAYPPYPTTNAMPFPQMPPTSSPSQPSPYPGYPQSNQYPGSRYPVYPGAVATSTANTPYPSYPGYPGSTPYPVNNTPGLGSMAPGSTSTISEEHIKASLLSAAEDKVRNRLRETFAQGQAELETLRRTQTELTQGQKKLDEMLRRLEDEQCELDKNVVLLKEKVGEIEESTKRLEGQDTLDIDEAVTTTAPLYKQLLTAYAEEAATEDAIYYLDEGLRKGVLEVDVFLKNIRSLARRQFMLRALMLRCREKGGLAV